MIYPHYLHSDLVQTYLELLTKFKANILTFKNLTEIEYYNSENMSIQVLSKDIYGDAERYVFWWNHYQKSENHILELSKCEDSAEYNLKVVSNVYKIVDKTRTQLNLTDPVVLYQNYISLYYANSWFSQLIDED